MKILMNTGGLAETNAYLVVDEAARVAAIIDAPGDTSASLLGTARQNNWDIQYLLLTHGHWDHITDHPVVTEAFPNAKILIHKLDEPKLLTPGSEHFILPYEIPPRRPDAYLEDPGKIHIGSISLAAMHTPGHSPGHIVFYSNEHAILFSGDLLMAGGVGRWDFSDCSLVDLKKSIRRMMLLPDHTRVFPGHGPNTTIGHERQSNPFIREFHLGERD